MEVLSFSAVGIPNSRAFFSPISRAILYSNSRVAMPHCSITDTYKQAKLVWIWTESMQVMTTAVERGWNTFVFPLDTFSKEISNKWSCKDSTLRLLAIALIHSLFIEGTEIFDECNRRVATLWDVSSPQELALLQPNDNQADNIVINFQGDWQVIPAENVVATFQGCKRNVLAVATSSAEAQVFLEALEKGLDGVILKVEEIEDILKLKEYFDRQTEIANLLCLTKATVTRIEALGMGDRVCVDLCSLMRPGEGLLVGSFARGLFLVHSECLESNYIASRPFRVNAGPVHSYVAVPNGKTCYLSELKAGKEVIVVDQSGLQRTAIVGRVKIESRPLVLVEAKDVDNGTYSIFLQNAETVGLVCPYDEETATKTMIPVTSLKAGDEIMIRPQGGARHTGIEIHEFILEK